MKIEIWSDIMCPFCYIGKRKLELALEKFKYRDDVKIIWHSYLLQPYIKYEEGKSIYNFLAESKGLEHEQVLSMTEHVTEMAQEVGLNFNFDKIVVANTFDAHRLTHFAASKGLQNEAEEQLFKAYFVEGKNIGDHQVLKDTGVALGLDGTELEGVLSSDQYIKEVKQDVAESQSLNIRGVPFFVFNRKWGLSGAQPVETFLEVLEKAYAEEKPFEEVETERTLSCDDESCG